MVQRVAAASLRAGAGQNAAMERAVAISRETVGSSGIYSSIVRTAPGGRTEVHHHGACETSIYIISGQARFHSGATLTNVIDADAGDFIYVPAYEVHVEENRSGTEALVVLVSRNCDGPVVEYV